MDNLFLLAERPGFRERDWPGQWPTPDSICIVRPVFDHTLFSIEPGISSRLIKDPGSIAGTGGTKGAAIQNRLETSAAGRGYI